MFILYNITYVYGDDHNPHVQQCEIFQIIITTTSSPNPSGYVQKSVHNDVIIACWSNLWRFDIRICHNFDVFSAPGHTVHVLLIFTRMYVHIYIYICAYYMLYATHCVMNEEFVACPSDGWMAVFEIFMYKYSTTAILAPPCRMKNRTKVWCVKVHCENYPE